jgi:hypothetical protein
VRELAEMGFKNLPVDELVSWASIMSRPSSVSASRKYGED